MMKLKQTILGLSLALSVGALAACGSSNDSTTSTGETDNKIVIGWQPSMEAQFYVAKDGIFESNGLEVELVKFTSGPPMFAALNNGSVDVAYMGLPPAVTAMAEDLPVKMISIEQDASNGEGLVANPESGISSVKDLVGKSVAVARGSSAEAALLTALKQNDIDVSEVKIVDLDVTTIVAAFKKGDVDSVWVWEPWLTKLETAGGNIVTTDGDNDFNTYGTWVANEKWLNESQDEAKLFLQSLSDANEVIKTEPEKAVSAMATNLEISEEEATKILDKVPFATIEELLNEDYIFSLNDSVIEAGKGAIIPINRVSEFLYENGSISKQPNGLEFIDNSALESLQ